MPVVMFAGLDKFFFVFHTGWILFVLFGWLWRKSRRLNLILISATAFSWFFLGIWFGYGYCPCTDWHWQVRMRLGYHDMPSSYIAFLVKSLSGWNVEPDVVDIAALAGLVSAFFSSVVLNLRDRREKRKADV